MVGTRDWPEVEIVEESAREGMQIESRSIPTSVKVELIDRLSATGLGEIVVGAFVSPAWVPQMADIDDVIARLRPVEGVTYRALAFNERGRERRRALTPPLSDPPAAERYATRVHLCDVFVRRNLNIRRQDEIASWPRTIETAVAAGAEEASIAINAAWGSNFLGPFSQEERTALLRSQHELWSAAGIPVRRIWIGDPMAWNAPHDVRAQLDELQREFPEVTTYHLHLHDARGTALTSAYTAIEALDPSRRLVIDSSIGGIGGCPYCGTGRATGMIATEDFVALLQRMGLATHIDLEAVVDTARWLSRTLGRTLHGRVAAAGPCPDDDHLYPFDLPLIETFEEAEHAFTGPRAYANSRAPWKEGDPLRELVATRGALA